MEDAILDYNEIGKEKKALMVTSQTHKLAMEQELARLAEKAKKVSTTALIIGGTALAVYFIGKFFFSGRGKKKIVVGKKPATELMIAKPKEESAIVRMIKEQIALFLIALAKEKLTALIKAAESKR
ncbi:MAG TPA: hypothetical protein VIK89_01865 [Cytophagaceae bacterium]